MLLRWGAPPPLTITTHPYTPLLLTILRSGVGSGPRSPAGPVGGPGAPSPIPSMPSPYDPLRVGPPRRPVQYDIFRRLLDLL